MKTEDTLLIEKLLEGSIAEKESISLLNKIENKEIDISEVLELVKMHSLIYAEFHQDKNADKLLNIVNRAIGEQKSNLSERVIRRIERKKKNNFNWTLAAVLFLSFLAGAIYYINRSSQIISNDTKSSQTAISGISIANETALMKTYVLPDGSTIELFPNSAVNIKTNLIVLEKGKLLANIKKQQTLLNFNAGDSVCKIIGTKFILETATQQNKPTTELIVTEGLVEMNAFNKKEMVKINQRCIASSYDQKLILSDIQREDEIKNILNSNIIYSSNFEKDTLENFWESWSVAENQTLRSSKKITLVINNNNSNTFINSKVFKTFYKNIRYHIELMPTINQGSMDVSMTFSKKGVPYHQDGFILTKENNLIKVINYQVIDGVRKDVEKGSFPNIYTPFKFTGTITHQFTVNTPTGERLATSDELESGKFSASKAEGIIEDVSIKIEVKTNGNSEGKIELLNATIERLSKNSKK